MGGEWQSIGNLIANVFLQPGRRNRRNESEFVKAAKQLTAQIRLVSCLPVFIVLRLVSRDMQAWDYYRGVEEHIQLNFEVLSDLDSEAALVNFKGNGWLTYSPVLHKIREAGTFLRLFDLLNERPFTPMEVALFSQLLLRQFSDDSLRVRGRELVKSLSSDPERLLEIMSKYNNEGPLVYNPLQRSMTPPIDIEKARWAILPLGTNLKNMVTNGLDAFLGMLPSQRPFDNGQAE